MIREAKLKLTMWYVLIIMSITIGFSIFIYNNVSKNAERALLNQQTRIIRRLQQDPQINSRGPMRFQLIDDTEALIDLKKRLLIFLLMANFVLLSFSAFLAYKLAGVTLRPIESMIKKQKEFVSNVSHELKTPLTSLQTQVEVLKRKKTYNKDEYEKVFNSLLDYIRGMTNLTNSLLEDTKFIELKYDQNIKKVDIEKLINKAVHLTEANWKRKNLSINVSVENTLLTGNEAMLTRLIIILLDNAIKFSPIKSEIEIKTHTSKGYLYIKVRDEGLGIPSDKKDLIFDRFYKIDTSRNSEGHGLGLYLAKEIANAHKGTIKVHSEENKGSEFEIKIPINP